MDNTTLKFGSIAFALVILTGCQGTNVPEYFPGYYQEAKYHTARYERPYYDYYGNYHSAYIHEPYEEPGRWHRASVSSIDNVGRAVYVEPEELERQSEEDVGDIAADKNEVTAVIR